MNFIAIDTSQEYLTVITSKNGKTEIVHNPDCAFLHSVVLLDTIENAMEKIELKPSEVDLFAVTIGAGSFTGIRIGVSTAKGFCATDNVKALSITSFDTIAYAEPNGGLAVIDAKHGNYYVAGYTGKELTYEPKFITKDELLSISGYKFLSALPIEGIETTVVDPSKGLLNAVLSKANEATCYENLSPLYLRLSQAEEGRK